MPSSASRDCCPLSLHDALPIYVLARGADLFVLRLVLGFTAVGLLELADPTLDVSFHAAAGARHREPSVAHVSLRGRDGELMFDDRSEEHTSELQSLRHLVCRLLPPAIAALFPYTTLFRSMSSPAALIFLSFAWFLVSLPSACLNWPIQRWTLASTPPPALDTVSRPSRMSPSEAGMENSCSMTDRKSTRLNSSHLGISYAVFCLPRLLPSFPTRRSSDLCPRPLR